MSEKPNEYEKIFQSITSVVLGRKLTGHSDYEDWLSKNVSQMTEVKSAISSKPVYLPPFDFYAAIKSRVVEINEAYSIVGKNTLAESDLDTLSLSNAANLLRKISITTPDTQYGSNSNLTGCSIYYNAHSCLKTSAMNMTKSSLYSFWPRQSDYTLGCYYLFASQFCIKCYNSENLTRCFEMSDCSSCSDSMFCHNSENLTNCMFCFNVKSKQYAICNVEVGREKYMDVKAKVIDALMAELEKSKRLSLSIFNLS